jgi:hypothetical protein
MITKKKAVKMDNLSDTEYTPITIAIDMSGSLHGLEDDLKSFLETLNKKKSIIFKKIQSGKNKGRITWKFIGERNLSKKFLGERNISKAQKLMVKMCMQKQDQKQKSDIFIGKVVDFGKCKSYSIKNIIKDI